MKNLITAGFAAAIAMTSAAHAVVTFEVEATASIYFEGDGSYSADGTAPFVHMFTPGDGLILSFLDVTGQTNCCSSTPNTDPDGNLSGGNTDIDSAAGISGIVSPGQLFLAGVFIDSSNPPASASTPAVLDFFAIGTNFLTLSPELNQSFFIGDGVTGAFDVQEFLVPSGADTLVLGFIDAFAFRGAPSFYDDNRGAVRGGFEIVGDPIPVPGALPLMAAGLGLAALRRRKQRNQG